METYGGPSKNTQGEQEPQKSPIIPKSLIYKLIVTGIFFLMAIILVFVIQPVIMATPSQNPVPPVETPAPYVVPNAALIVYNVSYDTNISDAPATYYWSFGDANVTTAYGGAGGSGSIYSDNITYIATGGGAGGYVNGTYPNYYWDNVSSYTIVADGAGRGAI
jgi:hypothetical protein